MGQTYEQALKYMDNTVHELDSRVPTPDRIATKNGFIFRYVEKSIPQAIVQKLAQGADYNSEGASSVGLLLARAQTQTLSG